MTSSPPPRRILSAINSGLSRLDSVAPVVKVKSVPRGARITFDSKPYATTDLAIKTYPGAHTITLELDGYETEQRTIVAAEEKTVEVSAELHSTTREDAASRRVEP